MNGKCLCWFLLVMGSLPLSAQRLKKADKAIIDNLKMHISYLADDKLEGRRAGSPGEQLARDYIKGAFEKAGLAPGGDNDSFFQPFNISDGKIYQSGFLFINDHEVKASDYFPLPNSPASDIASAPSIALKESGVPWFYNISDDLHDAENNIHFDVFDFVSTKAKEAARKGAIALFVYDTSKNTAIKYNPYYKSEQLPIPVVFVSRDIATRYFRDEGATLDIKMKIKIDEQFRNSRNVVGYLDNKSPYTIVIGAHYDHLGFGEDGNSLNNTSQRSKQKLIHNGADDNASGVAGLLELARLLKNSKVKNNNFLFIAFSGEESGLLGSRYFVEHPTVSLTKINYMINLDMIGRLNDNHKTVVIGGYGTSPGWSEAMSKIKSNAFVVKFDSSGSGPSDHTSFYRKQIPVLFFFTGLHSDYHKPEDDHEKINYTGELRIVQYIFRVLQETNNARKLAFLNTRELPTASTASFTVGLGIMPDYSFSGNGVRIDGLSEGRAAQKAGLQTGDIVIQLGENPVSSLENYMQALGTFKKGDKTKVKVKRATATIEADIIF